MIGWGRGRLRHTLTGQLAGTRGGSVSTSEFSSTYPKLTSWLTTGTTDRPPGSPDAQSPEDAARTRRPTMRAGRRDGVNGDVKIGDF